MARVNDALFAPPRAQFSEEQAVAFTVRTAPCAFFNRFSKSLRIDIQPDAPTLHAGRTGARETAG